MLPVPRDVPLNFSLQEAQEGLAKFLIPERIPTMYPTGRGPAAAKGPVFYNPGMELNRDFAVACLQAYQARVDRPLAVCDPMAGCGVRGIRFAVEVVGVRRVEMADLNPTAVELARSNVTRSGLQNSVLVHHDEAAALLASHGRPGKRFDYVDVDPFGSPAVFIEPAIRSLRNDGMLAFTATDVAVLCGVHARACVRRYSAKPLRSEYAHEVAARILLGFAAQTAARSDIAIHPLFIHSTDHYIRVYVQAAKSSRNSDRCIENMGCIHHCHACLNRRMQPGLHDRHRQGCEKCGAAMDFGGPLWLGPLWDEDFCNQILQNIESMNLGQKRRMFQIMHRIAGEIHGPPTFYDLSAICDALNSPMPPTGELLETLKLGGYEATLTHFHPQGIRTVASISDISRSIHRSLSSPQHPHAKREHRNNNRT